MGARVHRKAIIRTDICSRCLRSAPIACQWRRVLRRPWSASNSISIRWPDHGALQALIWVSSVVSQPAGALTPKTRPPPY